MATCGGEFALRRRPRCGRRCDRIRRACGSRAAVEPVAPCRERGYPLRKRPLPQRCVALRPRNLESQSRGTPISRAGRRCPLGGGFARKRSATVTCRARGCTAQTANCQPWLGLAGRRLRAARRAAALATSPRQASARRARSRRRRSRSPRRVRDSRGRARSPRGPQRSRARRAQREQVERRRRARSARRARTASPCPAPRLPRWRFSGWMRARRRTGRSRSS